MVYNISQNEYDDFMDEDDTQPFVRLDGAQRELDNAEAIAQLAGRAQVLGYDVDPPKNWMERLERALDRMIVSEDVIPFDAETL